MSPTTQTLLLLAGIHAAQAMVPGPNMLLVVRSAIYDRKLGLVAAAGIWPAGIAWAVLAMFGVNAVLTKIPQLTNVMYLLCGCYLAWFGITLFRKSFGAAQSITIGSTQTLSARQVFISGLIASATNPKGIAYWMSIFAATHATAMPATGQATAILMMPTISFVWYTFLSFIVASKALQKYLEMQRHWIDRIAGVVMIAFGANLLSFLI